MCVYLYQFSFSTVHFNSGFVFCMFFVEREYNLASYESKGEKRRELKEGGVKI